VVTRIKSFFSSLFFSSVEERKKEEREDKVLDLVKALIEDHKEERQFFRDWLTGFQTSTVPQPSRNHVDEEIIEAIENEARLGNTLAQDIVASDERMKEYIQLRRDSYY
jgi:predicted secreted protein